MQNFKKISTNFLLDEDKALLDLTLRKILSDHKQINRVLLINPPDGDEKMFNLETARLRRYPNYPPYGLGIIANHLKKRNFEVKILNLNDYLLTQANEDENFTYKKVYDHLVEEVKSFSPDFIGLTCMFTMTHNSLKKIVDILNNEFEIPIAAGGVHITNALMSEKTKSVFVQDLKNINFFFIFESELAFVDFLNFLNSQNYNENNYNLLRQIFIRKDDKTIIEIDDRSVPKGEDVDFAPLHSLMHPKTFGKYGKIGSFSHLKKDNAIFSSILSNRGCRASCTFCSVRNFNGKSVRTRSVQSVIDELLYLRNELEVDHVMFLDDDLLYDRERAINLFSEMDKQKVGITWDASNGLIAAAIKPEVAEAMSKSGCVGVYLGMESGNPQILKQIRKPGTIKNFLNAASLLKQYPQINTRVLLMIGFPNETYDNIMDTVKVSLDMDLDWYQVTPLQPLPNTPIFDQMSNDGLLSNEKFDQVRYIGGSYGKNRKSAEKKKNILLNDFEEIFKDKDKNSIPNQEDIKKIWAFMNYKLNFERLKNIENPLKIEQAYKYLKYIAKIVAPNDAVVWYYYKFLASKMKDENNLKTIEKEFNFLVNQNMEWKTKLASLNLQ